MLTAQTITKAPSPPSTIARQLHLREEQLQLRVLAGPTMTGASARLDPAMAHIQAQMIRRMDVLRTALQPTLIRKHI